MHANRYHANVPSAMTPADRIRAARPIHERRVYTLGQATRHAFAILAAFVAVAVTL